MVIKSAQLRFVNSAFFKLRHRNKLKLRRADIMLTPCILQKITLVIAFKQNDIVSVHGLQKEIKHEDS